MTAADTLRAYHRALGDERTASGLTMATRAFRRNRAEAVPRELNGPMTVLLSHHLDRVKGRGSPAICDEALARVIRENINA